MADYAFSTNAFQEAALTDKRRKVNAERAAENPPLPPFDDNPAYVNFVIANTLIVPLLVQFVEARLQLVANAYRTGTPAQRSAVDTALGL